MANNPYASLFERLLANSDGPPEDQLEGTGCWPWTGNLSNWNYGTYQARVNGRPRKQYAHRSVEQIMRDNAAQLAADLAEPDPWKLGPTVKSATLHPDDETIDHRCCYRRCISPDHWDVVTRAQNTAIMRARLTKTSETK